MNCLYSRWILDIAINYIVGFFIMRVVNSTHLHCVSDTFRLAYFSYLVWPYAWKRQNPGYMMEAQYLSADIISHAFYKS